MCRQLTGAFVTNPSKLCFVGVKLNNYKAFKDFSLQLDHLNVLTGRNNGGKSTILNAFRILSEGIRRARARNPELVTGPDGRRWGHRIPLDDLPVASENIFCDYDDSQPASIDFYTTDDARPLTLFFPEAHTCYFIPGTKDKPVKSAREFNANFDISVGFVPILGPVEHKEPLYQRETARLALLGPRAARNFRNIWHHYPDDFDTFRSMLRQTWPAERVNDFETPGDSNLV